MATLTIADLDNGKRDLQTVDEVANSRAATATTRFGQQTTTLYEAIRRINATGDEILSNLGFRVPVPYTSGLNVTDSRFTVTGPDGKVYAPLSAPFTTGAWDPVQWYVLQNDLNDHKLLIFDTLAAGESAAAVLPDGQKVLVDQNQALYSVSAGILQFVRFTNRLEVSPEDYGAAEGDPTSALQRFFDAVFDNGLHGLSSGKVYNTTATLILRGSRGSINFASSVIRPDASVLVGVQWGEAEAPLADVDVTRLLVDREVFDGSSENVGHLYVNAYGGTYSGVESRWSKYNHVFRPDSGSRVAYNDWIKICAVGGVYNVWADQQGSGFANENNFFGGRLFTSSNTINNVHAPNFNQANTNRLWGVTLEGTGQRAVYCNSQDWTINNCRTEGSWSVAAIHLGPQSARCHVNMPRQDQQVVDEGVSNIIIAALGSKQSQANNGRTVKKFQRTGAATVNTVISGNPTASTTSNSKSVVASALGDLAVGDFINIVGAVNMGRVEYINGLTITLDSVASATVSGAAMTRVLPPVVDISDDFPNSGNSFLARLYAGRDAATAFFLRAFARDVEKFHVTTQGEGFFSNGVKLGQNSNPLRLANSVTESLSFGSIGAGLSAEVSVAVPGAGTASGIALATPSSSLVSGLIWSARVSGSNTVAVRVANTTSAPITPAVVNWRVGVLQL